MIVVAIIGALSFAALPNFFRQMTRTRQQECSAVLSQVLTTTMAYSDEFGEPPENWSELNDMVAILLENGTASSATTFGTINLRGGNYQMSAATSTSPNTIIYTFECIPRDPDAIHFNVEGCVSLFNGATDIRLGDGENSAQAVDCT